MTESIRAYRKQLRARCRAFHGDGGTTPAQMLTQVATWCETHAPEMDLYGTGPLIEDFEARVSGVLGFEAARFMPSGTMAQQIALRIWCERAGVHHFGMHPTSHVELHEQRSYAHLHGLRATLVGPEQSPLLACHLEAIQERLAALLVELPIREAGGQLPSWEDLQELKVVARGRDTRLHLDGARLWETAAWYGHSYGDICAGFDSCYVSFYKGIGALSGAMLLGSADFIEEAALWQRRCGGNLYTLAPNVASAAMLFDERLARMPAYFERAVTLAGAIGAVEGVQVLPDPPQTNMMHFFLPLAAPDANEARDRVAEETGLWLFSSARPTEVPDRSRVELYVSEAAMSIDDPEITAGFQLLVS